MSRKGLSAEQYKGLLIHATPPADRWKDGINGAERWVTYRSLFQGGLLVRVASDDRDDTVVPTTKGWRALREYEAAHRKCVNCGCHTFVVE